MGETVIGAGSPAHEPEREVSSAGCLDDARGRKPRGFGVFQLPDGA